MAAGPVRYLHELGFALDCAFNALLGGWASEPFSARCYRCEHITPLLGYGRVALDAVLGAGHCQRSYEWIPAHLHLPPELR